jgi:hypothetical protein
MGEFYRESRKVSMKISRSGQKGVGTIKTDGKTAADTIAGPIPLLDLDADALTMRTHPKFCVT